MNTLLWTFQLVLVLVFLGSGIAKSSMSKERMLATGQTGVRDYPVSFIRVIAACEVLGAIGLVVPWATHVVPQLTPIAAVGLGVIMLGAARAHARLHEPLNVAANLTLLAMAAVVAVGRWT